MNRNWKVEQSEGMTKITVVPAGDPDEMTEIPTVGVTTTAPGESAPTWTETILKYRDPGQRMVTNHIHDYAGITGKRVHTGKAILFRVCGCGDSKAFEMGPREAMRTLYLQLRKTNPRRNHETTKP